MTGTTNKGKQTINITPVDEWTGETTPNNETQEKVDQSTAEKQEELTVELKSKSKSKLLSKPVGKELPKVELSAGKKEEVDNLVEMLFTDPDLNSEFQINSVLSDNGKKSELLRQQSLHTIENYGETGKDMVALLGEVGEFADDMQDKWTGMKSLVRKISKYIPFLGTVKKRMTNAKEVLENLEKGLEAADKRLSDVNSMLEVDSQSYVKEVRARQEQLAAAEYFTVRIKEKMADLDPTQKVKIQENMLIPIEQRVSDIHETMSVNALGAVQIHSIQKANNYVQRNIRRAKEVTLTTLYIMAANNVAISSNKNIQQGIDNFNQGTSEVIEKVTNDIGEQLQKSSERQWQTNLNIEKLEGSRAKLKQITDEALKNIPKTVTDIEVNVTKLKKLNNLADTMLQDIDESKAAQKKVEKMDI